MTSRYSADRIQRIFSLEGVRKRPGMYIGSIGLRGLHQLVYEVIYNSIDEALLGYSHNIEVHLNADFAITVKDDGRGIFTEILPLSGKSFLETLMTSLCYCDNREIVVGDYYSFAVVNALCEWVEVKVWHEAKMFSQGYEKGIAISKLDCEENPENCTGICLTFKPDSQVFKDGIQIDRPILAKRLEELSYLNPGLKFTFSDRRIQFDEKNEIYYYPQGIKEYLAKIRNNCQPLYNEVIYLQHKHDRLNIEIAFQWFDKEKSKKTDDFIKILSFVNYLPTIEGGTHVDGFKAAIGRFLQPIALQGQKIHRRTISWRNLQNGLNCIISVTLPNPEFDGAVRNRLINAEVKEIVDELVGKILKKYIELHPNFPNAILSRYLGL